MDWALERIESQLSLGGEPGHHIWCLPKIKRGYLPWKGEPEAFGGFP